MSTNPRPEFLLVYCEDHPERPLHHACCRCGDFFCGDCFDSKELCRECYQVLGPLQPNEEGRYLGLSRRSSAVLGATVNLGMLTVALGVAYVYGGDVSGFASRFFCLLFLAELSFVFYSMRPSAEQSAHS